MNRERVTSVLRCKAFGDRIAMSEFYENGFNSKIVEQDGLTDVRISSEVNAVTIRFNNVKASSFLGVSILSCIPYVVNGEVLAVYSEQSGVTHFYRNGEWRVTQGVVIPVNDFDIAFVYMNSLEVSFSEDPDLSKTKKYLVEEAPLEELIERYIDRKN